MSNTTVVALAVAVSLVACSAKDEEARGGGAKAKDNAHFCKESTELLREGVRDDKLFKEMMSMQLESCSKACDGKDQPSCDRLDAALDKLCKVASDVCKALCDETKPGSLTAGACKRSGGGASSAAAASPSTVARTSARPDGP